MAGKESVKMLYPDKYKDLDYCLTMNYYRSEDALPEDVLEAFYNTLIIHISCVQEAGQTLGLPEYQLAVHDITKFTGDEFFAYAMHFQGGGAPDEFALAWLHHIHHNPHHWQYWMFADGYSPKGSQVEAGTIEMPQHFALEMVADWIGASKAYTGSDDMSDWLWKNIPRISLHSKTAEFVRATLRGLGYDDMLALNFRSEVLLAAHNL